MLSNSAVNLRAYYIHPKLSWNFLRVYGVYGVYPFGTTLRISAETKFERPSSTPQLLLEKVLKEHLSRSKVPLSFVKNEFHFCKTKLFINSFIFEDNQSESFNRNFRFRRFTLFLGWGRPPRIHKILRECLQRNVVNFSCRFPFSSSKFLFCSSFFNYSFKKFFNFTIAFAGVLSSFIKGISREFIKRNLVIILFT